MIGTYRFKKITTVVALAVGAVMGFGGPAQASPIAPDQWHCAIVTGQGDQLCLHLNQFLGWWTGFSTEFRRTTWGDPWLDVQLRWTDSQGESGWFPSSDRPFHLELGQVGAGDSWADLPSRACVTVKALLYPINGPIRWSSPLTVCRDN